MRIISLAMMLIMGLAHPAAAVYDDSGHYARVLDCLGADEDVRIELFLPNAVIYHDGKMDNPKKPVTGYYILDLEKIGKGKSLEPVKVWRDDKAKVLVLKQDTRGMTPTRIPLDGGVVDFDNRFATGARCKPFRQTHEDDNAVAYPPARPAVSNPDAN